MTVSTSPQTLIDCLGSLGPDDGSLQGAPRHKLDRRGWFSLIESLHAHPEWELLSEWAETQHIHAAFYDSKAKELAVASLDLQGSVSFPCLSLARPGAMRLERTIQEFWGLVAESLPDTRPWLDHGTWSHRTPMASKPAPRLTDMPAYEFLPVEGEGLHQIPVGPVHAGIIEPGHFRFTLNGETVVRMEEKMGWVHKGTLSLIRGRKADDAVRLAARLSGDSTVAHALAFCRAVEAAWEIEPTKRAVWLRALMAELERLANHFWDVAMISNDVAFTFPHAQCSILRESVLAACDTCFGHRLMMDRIIPGGVTVDLSDTNRDLLVKLAQNLRQKFAPVIDMLATPISFLDRTMTTGILKPHLAQSFAAGGFIGRASGRAFDVRRDLPYAPYPKLEFNVPVFKEGDVQSRLWVRIREIESSLDIVEQILARLPSIHDMELQTPRPTSPKAMEGLALVEGFRGDIVTWVKLDADMFVTDVFIRDPSWLQWPLLEAVLEGNIVADFPVCNKSFNCSYSGQDL
ncbi:MAG: nickel-dependent hydrogenase large subunit [Alphaproteobacteria bacterium]|nr:MAG: nickel-dependent hydrogenase large subunit [Alphaproteobacteria bacterium]